jgi:hypothetical protein
MRNRAVSILLLSLFIFSCSPAAVTVLPSETTHPTVEPTSTEIPPTATLEPTETSTLTPISVADLIESDEILYWEEIPLVPGAVEIEEGDNYCSYSVDMPIEIVEEFYTQMYGQGGWLRATRMTAPGEYPGGIAPILLIFMKGNEGIRILLIGSNTSSITIEWIR